MWEETQWWFWKWAKVWQPMENIPGCDVIWKCQQVDFNWSPLDFKWSLEGAKVWPWLDHQLELVMCEG